MNLSLLKFDKHIKYVNLCVLYKYFNKACHLSVACAMGIAPTAEGIVRPDLLDYSDTTEHALMCQATLSDTYQPHSFLFCKCTTKQKPQISPNPMKPVAVIPCLTSHHTIHSICFCSHPWCKWRHWAIPAFSLSAAGGRHLQKGHELCLCLWFHLASSTALFHLHTEDIIHLQANVIGSYIFLNTQQSSGFKVYVEHRPSP